jgi:hypothetical protein
MSVPEKCFEKIWQKVPVADNRPENIRIPVRHWRNHEGNSLRFLNNFFQGVC